MIEERVTVVALDGEMATVEARQRSTCGQCAIKRGCGTSALADYVAGRPATLAVDNTLGAQPGDEVILGLAENVFLAGSLMVYGRPLAGFLFGAWAAQMLAPASVAAPDARALLGAIAGLAAGAVWTHWRLRSPILRRRVRPVMLRVGGRDDARPNSGAFTLDDQI